MDQKLREPDSEQLALHKHAVSALDNAYVPYSNFRVGAALQFEDGTITTGCNVENASFGLTICAERTAIVRSIASGLDPKQITRVAVAVDTSDGSPCGMCRQFLSEFAPNATISYLHEGKIVVSTVHELLPGSFQSGAMT